ncbi:two pore domain potassium channel family protein [Bacillaceae bacterium SIJ1]|uniref:potassium channel family protein n=1 Tax=Litoribacterium kuwaitense TaxID=1398745 RepID=UPI0013EE0E72|nr:potassium channel family protein [Litoribacterium kuwaitense]NGP45629.1 two pore domain potassium channel family protein [Litoribacterium kuwaitense]
MHFFKKLGLNLIRMRNMTLFLATLVFVVICTFVMYALEPENLQSLFNSFYFVLTTFATVGYGDFSPVTMAGKVFTILCT